MARAAMGLTAIGLGGFWWYMGREWEPQEETLQRDVSPFVPCVEEFTGRADEWRVAVRALLLDMAKVALGELMRVWAMHSMYVIAPRRVR